MDRIGILLVDDHAIVRAGYRHLLDAQPRFRVVAEAAHGAAAYRRFAEGGIDVVIVDLALPGVGGLELLRRMRQREPALRALVFSMHEERIMAEHAFAAGALGYLCKRSEPERLVAAVGEVAAGRRFVDPALAPRTRAAPLAQLSTREREVLRQLAEGRRPADIATSLCLSDKTIANHQTAIRQKLGVDSGVALARVAIAAGLVPL